MNTATGVFFGDHPSPSFRTSGTTRISAVAPPGKGKVGLRVITLGGMAESGAWNFTYEEAKPAPPRMTSVTPTQGPPRGGSTGVVTGSGFAGATAVTFGNGPAARFTVDGDGQVTAVAPPGQGTVLVQVHGPAGTSTDSVTFSYKEETPAAPAPEPPPAPAPAQGPVINGIACGDPEISTLWKRQAGCPEPRNEPGAHEAGADKRG